MAPSFRLTVPLHPDETPTSFVSRLAARNGSSMRTFCHDYDIPFQGVVDGNAETLEHIATLARADLETLRDAAFVKFGFPLDVVLRNMVGVAALHPVRCG
jgi:hypothetical protein